MTLDAAHSPSQARPSSRRAAIAGAVAGVPCAAGADGGDGLDGAAGAPDTVYVPAAWARGKFRCNQEGSDKNLGLLFFFLGGGASTGHSIPYLPFWVQLSEFCT